MNKKNIEEWFIYRWYVWMILYYFNNKTIESEEIKSINEYYNVWEEGLSLDLMLFYIKKAHKITFKLWIIIINLLDKFPADGTYVQIDNANETIKRINNSEITL